MLMETPPSFHLCSNTMYQVAPYTDPLTGLDHQYPVNLGQALMPTVGHCGFPFPPYLQPSLAQLITLSLVLEQYLIPS
jgi:hypothetical protein